MMVMVDDVNELMITGLGWLTYGFMMVDHSPSLTVTAGEGW